MQMGGRLLAVLVVGACWIGSAPARGADDAGWEKPLRASLEQMADQLTATLKPWAVPDRTFKVEDFGAAADGNTVNTTAIQKAIDKCSQSGGGVVLLSKGDYVTGTIEFKSGVMLQVDRGARLLASTRLADYPDRVATHQTIMETHYKMRLCLIYAENCERIGIRGPGIIDGRGKNFPGKEGSGAIPGRPFLLRIIECHQVVMDGIHLVNAAAWMENYLNCDDLIIQGITSNNQANWNNDGVDIDGCRNVIVRNSSFISEDDGLCFKGAGMRMMENVLVENCKAYSSCNALKFGTDSQGGFCNVVIRNVELGGIPANEMSPGIPPKGRKDRTISGISWETVDGATIENVLVTNAHITRAEVPIFLRIGNRGRTKPGLPKPAPGVLRRLIFEHITGDSISGNASIIAGIPGHRVEDVIICDVNISMAGGGTAAEATRNPGEGAGGYPDAFMFGTVPAYGFWMRHAENITLENIRVNPLSPDARPEFGGRDALNIVIDGKPFPLGANLDHS
jgi:polygalacturonase